MLSLLPQHYESEAMQEHWSGDLCQFYPSSLSFVISISLGLNIYRFSIYKLDADV